MILPKLLPAVAVATLIIALSAMSGCYSGSSPQREAAAEPTISIPTEVSPEIAVLAHRLVFAYMSDKTWGFFGATCEKWIEMDYEWDKSTSQLQQDERIKVTYTRQADRLLGPDELIFYVDIDSGDVTGDNKSETGRSGIAEGCDQW